MMVSTLASHRRLCIPVDCKSTSPKRPHHFPTSILDFAGMPGWSGATSGIKNFKELPREAQNYIRRIETLVGVPIAWIGTGAGRDDMVTRGFKVAAEAPKKAFHDQ